jgi:hypothetical protein
MNAYACRSLSGRELLREHGLAVAVRASELDAVQALLPCEPPEAAQL